MKTFRLRSALLGYLSAITLLIPVPATGQITPLGASTLAPSGVLGSFDYDDKHHVYLHAWEYQNRVWGRFLSADGAVLGASFVISAAVAPSGFAGRPRVTYTRGSSADEFLVMYASDVYSVGRSSNVFGQIVRYTGSGPTAGSIDPGYFAIAPYFSDSTLLQVLDAVVFNAATSRFLIVWEESPSGQYEVIARHIGLDGSPIGSVWNISQAPGSQGLSAAALDAANNRYLIAYAGDGGLAGFPSLGAFARILDANTGQPLSSPLVLAGGYNTEPAVTGLPARNGFLVTWTAFKPDRTVMAEFVPSSYPSANPDAPYLALDTPGNDGAASVVFDASSQYTVVAAMSDPKYIRASLLDATGRPQVAPFVLGTVFPTSGSYYPTVKSAEGGIFGLSYVIDYTSAVFERFQLTGGGPPPPPPPPPPPSCSLAINDTAATIPSGSVAGVLGITTGTGCSWTASVGASWLSASATSGSGSASLQWTAQPNSGAARSATITVSASGTSRTLTIYQAAWVSRPGDFTGDLFVDLIWQNQNTGALAVWKMNGFNLTSGDSLSPAFVPDTSWKIVAAADMDKDGSTDLIWQHDGGYVAVWLMRGSTRVSGELITQTPLSDTAWRIVGAGDFNGDGYADILWQHQDGTVAVWYMRGTTYLWGDVIALPLSDQGWRVVGAADMNGDGNVDLVWHHSTTGKVAIWLMNRSFLVDGSVVNESAPDTNWRIRALGDYDGDGDIDVLWQNTATGGLAAWIMNRTVVQGGLLLNMIVPDTNWKIVAPR